MHKLAKPSFRKRYPVSPCSSKKLKHYAISSCVLLRWRFSPVISPPAKISSNSDLLRRYLLQRRSPPATSAPATISLLQRLLQRRSPPASSLSSSVSSLPNLQCLPFVLDQQVLDLAKIEAGKLELEASLITTGLLASIAAAASHAFDTTRTRSQCTVLPKVFKYLFLCPYGLGFILQKMVCFLFPTVHHLQSDYAKDSLKALKEKEKELSTPEPEPEPTTEGKEILCVLMKVVVGEAIPLSDASVDAVVGTLRGAYKLQQRRGADESNIGEGTQQSPDLL
ncbi:hypothetical protein Ahy_B08g091567 [Arachis hypogaea]|uniref:Uncharacterized protein n=1 Tax=Arachis hypogaea TaxID=3818 RepID=A0A444Y2B0_ARAHY|nr:hypothetical protein Ahy_B08g091567 [Arachis hypogaea]